MPVWFWFVIFALAMVVGNIWLLKRNNSKIHQVEKPSSVHRPSLPMDVQTPEPKSNSTVQLDDTALKQE